MSAWAKPGVKCVCVTSEWHIDPHLPVDRVPMLNEVLTVAAKGGPFGTGLQFEEIPHLFSGSHVEAVAWWSASCFRPLITRSQEDDVRLIKSLLVDGEVAA